MANKRPKIPKAIETQVLLESRRRCCMCFFFDEDKEQKDGQIAHLDHDRSNNDIDNLCYMCLVPHHNEYDGKKNLTKNYKIDEVKAHREMLYEYNKSIKERNVSTKVTADMKGGTDLEKRIADIKLLKQLFSTFNINEIDTQVQDMCVYRIRENILHYWDDFSALMNKSQTRFFNQRLEKLMLRFYTAWNESLSFGKHFEANENNTIFHFRPTNEEEEEATKAFSKAALKLHLAIRNLVHYVMHHYVEVNLDKTNQYAYTERKRATKVILKRISVKKS